MTQFKLGTFELTDSIGGCLRVGKDVQNKWGGGGPCVGKNMASNRPRKKGHHRAHRKEGIKAAKRSKCQEEFRVTTR